MHKLSIVVHNAYNKFLPIAQHANISLNLNFPDPTQTITDPKKLQDILELHLNHAVKRASHGDITISVSPLAITIRDTGTIISKTTRDALSSEHVKIKSRVGFGTTVTISLAPVK